MGMSSIVFLSDGISFGLNFFKTSADLTFAHYFCFVGNECTQSDDGLRF